MINYGFTKEIDASFEDAVTSASIELKKEGFGILTQIDIAEKFKEKLGIDFKKYIILGACNPPSAHKAILVEENIGLMLPCNVIIYERQDKTVVSIIKTDSGHENDWQRRIRTNCLDNRKKVKKSF